MMKLTQELKLLKKYDIGHFKPPLFAPLRTGSGRPATAAHYAR